MPIIKSAIKRANQTIKRQKRNVATKRDVKSAVKAFMAKPTAETLSVAQSTIDKAVKKNVFEKNTAARRKSNLSRIAKGAGVKLVAAKKTVAKTAPAKKVATKKPTVKKPATKKTPAKKATK